MYFEPAFPTSKKEWERQHHKFWQAFVNDAFYSAWEAVLSNAVWEVTADLQRIGGNHFSGFMLFAS